MRKSASLYFFKTKPIILESRYEQRRLLEIEPELGGNQRGESLS